MTYESAMEFIASTYKFGSKLGLSRIRSLLGHMGDPQRGLKYVHVAGTNGKGSTVSFISNILMNAGYRTGVYTSPYIHRFNERITVNGAEISNADIGRIIGGIREKVALMSERGEGCPTEFEVVTALGFQYYYEQGCDIVVLETGLGGRLDSTNIIDASEVSVITTVDYDHMQILGNSLAEIAAEKAGIIKANGRVVLYPQAPEADAVIAEACRAKNAELYRLENDRVIPGAYDLNGQSFDFGRYKNLKLSMLSEFQCMNAATAIMAAEVLRGRGFDISDGHIHSGLFGARWPGRFEVMRREPVFIIDCAHNAQGAAHLAANLNKYFPGQKITFIVGVSADKDYQGIIAQVAPLAARFIATQADTPRALPAEELAGYLKTLHPDVYTAAQPADAARAAVAFCQNDGVICSFGSLFHAGPMREALM